MDMTKAHNLDFVKLNLAQIEELGDLVGFPGDKVKRHQIPLIMATEQPLMWSECKYREALCGNMVRNIYRLKIIKHD